MTNEPPAGTVTFELTQNLRCTPGQAWQLLTDPTQMNRWSTAKITLADGGVDDLPNTAGALRTVTLPGGRARLKEVVEHSEAPFRLDYRVHDGGPALLHHLGRQRIDPSPAGCTITWTVEMRLVSTVATRLLASRVRAQVAESLELLSRLDPPDEKPLAPIPVRVAANTAAPRRAALAVLESQRDLADRLAASDDPKQWFARVYSYVTQEMIDACPGLANPDWVLRLIPVFDEYYTRSLLAFERGEECEPMWQKAWSTCERRDPDNPARPVMAGLLRGVSAHIDADLPRAIADVHSRYYSDRDLREFRPDYLRLAPVFTAASDRLLHDLPRSHKPWWTTAASRIHPQVRDALLARRGYDVGKHRFRAFAAAVDTTARVNR
ncbi:SRPBCC family protein [Gordonia zhaorongruii]|uniref:SRPBCC family protein n=1 Tax=Gordonia zhaorongruii TaxID=2597659 RepID=UPI00104537D0|nr:SRPBCC family protein [Gordonia zhaorongruii]